jgi:ABC-2 type transport system permease protein
MAPSGCSRSSQSGRRGTAIGAGTVLAAASYLISSLAPVASWIRPGRYASLFYWSVGNSQLSRGVSVGDYAVLAVVGLCALAAAMLAFRRLDIH